MSHKRSAETKRRLCKLYEEAGRHYRAGAYFDEDKGRYIRYSVNSQRIKTVCKRVTRRRIKSDYENMSKGGYRKIYDYWWTVT